MNLTASDIVAIIKECKGSVHSFEISKSGGLKVVFNSTPIEAKNSNVGNPNLTSENNGTIQNLTPEQAQTAELTKQLVEQEDEKLLIENLKLSDPLKYEELLAMGELKDEDDSGPEQDLP